MKEFFLFSKMTIIALTNFSRQKLTIKAFWEICMCKT